MATLRFVSDASNVILLGPPGVAKTHLAVALAAEAIAGGHSVSFVTAHALVTDLGRAAREGKLEPRLRRYLKPKALVIDEVGYLPLDTLGATIFFQLVSARYERGSIVLTSNKSYADWGQVFGETTIATAVLDRLLHHSTTINIRGASYRLKERKRAGLLSAPSNPTPPSPSEAERKRRGSGKFYFALDISAAWKIIYCYGEISNKEIGHMSRQYLFYVRLRELRVKNFGHRSLNSIELKKAAGLFACVTPRRFRAGEQSGGLSTHAQTNARASPL